MIVGMFFTPVVIHMPCTVFLLCTAFSLKAKSTGGTCPFFVTSEVLFTSPTFSNQLCKEVIIGSVHGACTAVTHELEYV